MSVRKDFKHGRKVVVVDRRWPDDRRFRRMMPNQAVAKRLDSRIEAAIAEGRWQQLRKELDRGTAPETTIRQYADHYLEVYCKVRNRPGSVATKMSILKRIKRLLGRHQLERLEVRDVHAYVAKRLKQEVKAATVNREISVLRHMYEFAMDEGVIKENPIARIKKLKEYRAERPRISDTQVQAILKHLVFPVKQLVVFIYETGCRPSEAMALKRDFVDLEKQTAIFNLRKGGDNARVALTSRAVDAIGQVPELPGCPYVFWNRETGTHYERINETFHRARKKAGCPEVQLKDFRRELGIVLAESGQPLHVAQTQLGHSSIRTTEQFYAHFSPEFAIERARPVLEDRFDKPEGNPDGSQTGDADPTSDPSKKDPSEGASKLLIFKQLKR